METIGKEKREASASVYALYGQRLCRLASCKKPFTPARKDQVFCCPAHRQEYYNNIFEAGRHIIARKEAQERMKGVRAVTQDMTPQERLAALVETARAVFSRRPFSPFLNFRSRDNENKHTGKRD